MSENLMCRYRCPLAGREDYLICQSACECHSLWASIRFPGALKRGGGEGYGRGGLPAYIKKKWNAPEIHTWSQNSTCAKVFFHLEV